MKKLKTRLFFFSWNKRKKKIEIKKKKDKKNGTIDLIYTDLR